MCVGERDAECLDGQTHNWLTKPQRGRSQPLHFNTRKIHTAFGFAKSSSDGKPAERGTWLFSSNVCRFYEVTQKHVFFLFCGS